jgi:sarcosine oxidase subunit beta
MQLYRTLAADLDYNVMFSRRGHLTLAHNDSSPHHALAGRRSTSCRASTPRAIDPAEIKRLVPYLDTSADTRYPASWRAYHPPGGIIRHDAVVRAAAAATAACTSTQDPRSPGIDTDGPGARCARPRGTSPRRSCQRERPTVHAGGRDGGCAPAHRDVPTAGRASPSPFTVPARRGRVRHPASTSARPTAASSCSASVDPLPRTRPAARWNSPKGLPAHVIELMPAVEDAPRCASGAPADMTPDFSHHGRYRGGRGSTSTSAGAPGSQGGPGLR